MLPGIILVAIAAYCGGGGSGNVDNNVGGSATLSWDAPQTYVDGRPLGDALSRVHRVRLVYCFSLRKSEVETFT